MISGQFLLKKGLTDECFKLDKSKSVIAVIFHEIMTFRSISLL